MTSVFWSIFADVDATRCGEIGEELEGLFVEVGDGCITNLTEIMGQDLRGEAHSNTFCTLGQYQWELHRQGDGLLIAPVVRHLPLCGLGVEYGVKGKLRESGLDISWCSGTRACEDISPVTLCVDEQILLSHLHEGVANGGVAMRVELHRVAHDVRHLIISAVVHALHRVEDASLHGLQTVLDMGDGTIQDAITGVVQEPVLVHAAQVVYRCGIKAVYGLIVGMALLQGFRLLLFCVLRQLAFIAVFSYFVVHLLMGL